MQSATDPNALKKSFFQENTPLIQAIQEGDYETFQNLLDKADVNERGENNSTPLIEALYLARNPIQYQMVLDLLEHKDINVNLSDNTGVAPLGIVVVYLPHLAEKLLQIGANPNDYTYIRLKGGIDLEGKNYNRWRQLTLLSVAVRNQNENLAELLLRYGADINKVGDLDISPLSLAGRGNDIFAMKFLIQKGAQIETLPTNWSELTDSPDKCCSVVLRKVLKYASANCLHYLIKQGIKIPYYIHRKEGKYATPITYLLSQSMTASDVPAYEKSAQMLLNLGKKNPPFYAKYQPLDIKQTDYKGRNALYYAIRSGCSYSLCSGLATAQTVNQKDYKGETPFTLAVYQRKSGLFHLLLERGANPNEEIFYFPESLNPRKARCVREPVIFYALHHRDFDLIKVLIEHGANLLYRDGAGKMPIDYVKADFPDKLKKMFFNQWDMQQSFFKKSVADLRFQRMGKAFMEHQRIS